MKVCMIGLAVALLGLAGGCSSPLGGEKLDNPTGTYANNIAVRNIEAYSNPSPKNP